MQSVGRRQIFASEGGERLAVKECLTDNLRAKRLRLIRLLRQRGSASPELNRNRSTFDNDSTGSGDLHGQSARAADIITLFYEHNSGSGNQACFP